MLISRLTTVQFFIGRSPMSTTDLKINKWPTKPIAHECTPQSAGQFWCMGVPASYRLHFWGSFDIQGCSAVHTRLRNRLSFFRLWNGIKIRWFICVCVLVSVCTSAQVRMCQNACSERLPSQCTKCTRGPILMRLVSWSINCGVNRELAGRFSLFVLYLKEFLGCEKFVKIKKIELS